jgi:hypothetical protein
MPRFYIQTQVNYYYESDEGEFATEEEAEAFGWNIDNLQYDSVEEIKVEELESDEEEEEDE